ncbi:hypothetical protein NKG94_12840 [Micromonospora sp. M12]
MILDDLAPYWTKVEQRWDRTIEIVGTATNETLPRTVEVTEVTRHPRLAQITP